jgi:hypothetical protein
MDRWSTGGRLARTPCDQKGHLSRIRVKGCLQVQGFNVQG